MQNQLSTYHLHFLGVGERVHEKYENVRKNIKITSLGIDEDLKRFIASVESTNFDERIWFGFQFHPEKVNYPESFVDLYPEINTETRMLNRKLSYSWANYVMDKHKKSPMSAEDRAKYLAFNMVTQVPNETSGSFYVYVDRKFAPKQSITITKRNDLREKNHSLKFLGEDK